MPVNCAAITETLLESELFGHAKGRLHRRGARPAAASSRRRDGGTLFIDEVTETTPGLPDQAPARAAGRRGAPGRREHRSRRSTCASWPPPTATSSSRCSEKRFRQDLFYRLNVVDPGVPPLRERLEDVPLLAEHFLERANARSAASSAARSSAARAPERLRLPRQRARAREPGRAGRGAGRGRRAAARGLPPPAAAPRRGVRSSASPEPPSSGAPGPYAWPTRSPRPSGGPSPAPSSGLPTTSPAWPTSSAVSATTLWRKMKRLGLKIGRRG